MSLWYYDILLPEEEEDCSLSYELYGIITINNNIVKFVRSTSGYGCKYSWSMFLLENSLSNNFVSQMNLSRYNKKYQRKFISLVLVLKAIQ